MLKHRHISAKDYRVQNWKNGGGVTREIAVDNQTPYRWRVSSADLTQSGPFSLFEGYQRSLVLLEGKAKLTHSGKRTVTLEPFTVHRFSGDERTECEVISPGKDFGFLGLKSAVRGNCHSTSAAAGEDLLLPLRGQEHFLYVASGRLEVVDRNSNHRDKLASDDTIQVTRPKEEEFFDLKVVAEVPTRFLWIVVYLDE